MNNIKVKKIQNDRLNKLIDIQGLNSKKLNRVKEYQSIKDTIDLQNRISKVNQSVVETLKQNPIYQFNKKTKENEIIKILPKDKKSYHISFNTHSKVSKENLKTLFNLCKNKYGYFLYGKKWISKLHLNYDLSIEHKEANHLHLIIRDMTADDLLLLYGYFLKIIKMYHSSTTSFCKLIDNEQGALIYDGKGIDTRYYSSSSFIK